MFVVAIDEDGQVAGNEEIVKLSFGFAEPTCGLITNVGRVKTNKIMDEIRGTISPEMKLQMELSVAIANRV